MAAHAANTFRFLVATDNHLGSFEKAPVRREDSFVTFEEILQKAVEQRVDFILLGGDLFDENKPSHATLNRTMNLFRKYCMGSGSVDFRILSDPRATLSNGCFGIANFQDPNLNVAIPVFAIHGNHDDPVGEAALSALDLLSSAGLINYFGKSPSNDQIQINPVLLQKGTTKLALFGLGHVREERLHRCFAHKKVKFMRPAEDPDAWFNVFAIHQNRGVKGVGQKNGVHEDMLKGFLDLVIWGHEHETLLTPVPAKGAEYDIIQPGSSVMTGHGEETNEKKVALVEVEGTSYRVTPISLQSCRPAEGCVIALAEEEGLAKTTEEVTEYLCEQAEDLINKAAAKVALIPDRILQQNPDLRLPIVRMKVNYYPDFPPLNPVIFGGRFINKVANPHHMLQNLKKKPVARGAAAIRADGDAAGAADLGADAVFGDFPGAGEGASMANTISRGIHTFIKDGKRLSMLSEHYLTEAVFDYIQKSETAAVSGFVQDYMLRVQKGIWRDVKARPDVTDDQLRTLAAGIKTTADAEWQANTEGVAPGATAAAAAAPPAAMPLVPPPQRAVGNNALPAPLLAAAPPMRSVKAEPAPSPPRPAPAPRDDDEMPEPPPSMFGRMTPDDSELNSADCDAMGPLPTPKPAKPAGKRGKAAAKAAAKPAAKRGKRKAVDVDEDDSFGGGGAPPLSALKGSTAKRAKQAPAPPAQNVQVKAAASATMSVMANWGKKKGR
eukprot:TRINITY_DN17001_c0_g1_i1.p1 TRINITY_DN17001_c0_g1~~TRINITY_DN17001_c0_g1_i1.p1  ORF type:complete len:723 (+),score=301.21 TRINITY_DN17001_c0_g1_i1:65-2233(+)